MPTHQHTQSYYAASQTVTDTDTFEAETEVNIAATIDASTTNKLIDIALDVSEIQSIVISSDVTLTVKTNSSGSPDDTLTITGGKPYIWTVNSYDTCLLTTDVTKIYVTNGTSGDAALKISALVNVA